MDKNKAHYITVTGILVKNGRYLIAKRADWEKAFPGKWTVPGGKFEMSDYINRKKDTADCWYNVLEHVLKREIMEETGLEIGNIGYITSMVYIRSDGIPCLIISLYAEPELMDVRLCKALTDYRWVDIHEALKYDLIDGIYDELLILDNYLKKGQFMSWGRN